MKSSILTAILLLSANAAFAQTPGCQYNEYDYLDFNTDVANAVRAGSYPNGYTHYTEFGYNENRIINRECVIDSYGCTYNEQAYVELNPDVAQAIRNGSYRDGADHYGRYGRYENRQISYCGRNNPPGPQPQPQPRPQPQPPRPEPQPQPQPPHPQPQPQPQPPRPEPQPQPQPPRPQPQPQPQPPHEGPGQGNNGPGQGGDNHGSGQGGDNHGGDNGPGRGQGDNGPGPGRH